MSDNKRDQDHAMADASKKPDAPAAKGGKDQKKDPKEEELVIRLTFIIHSNRAKRICS